MNRHDQPPGSPHPFAGAHLSRRSFLRAAGVGAGTVSLAAILAACGNDEGGTTPAASPTFDWSKQKQAGEVTFVNWPLYLDKARVNGEVVHPSLERFMDTTGVQVEYLEQIETYEDFHAKILPLLEAGSPTGYDLITTGFPKWYPMLMQLGYLVELDHSLLPNFERYAGDAYKNLAYDPGNKFGIPYQSGITGIGYNVDMTGGELTSLDALFDPKYEGKVGMFRDTLDTPNMALLAIGVEPSTSTQDDWNAAADKLIEQRDAGIVRQYFGQGYIGALQAGEIAVSLAWSADVLQAQKSGYPNLHFAVADEGGLLWTDITAIPNGAEHPLDAIMLMDWFYQPEIAAQLTSWIQNVSPVPEAQQILRDQGDPVADDPLVFPTEDMYAKMHAYRTLTPDEQETWDDTFLPVYQS